MFASCANSGCGKTCCALIATIPMTCRPLPSVIASIRIWIRCSCPMNCVGGAMTTVFCSASSCIQAMDENADVLTMAQVKSTTNALAMWTKLRGIYACYVNRWHEEALCALLDGMATEVRSPPPRRWPCGRNSTAFTCTMSTAGLRRHCLSERRCM